MRYRGLLAVAAAIVAIALMSPSTGRAARDLGTVKPSSALQEIVVFEVPNCTYCDAFRQIVLPRYQRSKRAGDLPIRFVDLNDPAADQLKLSSAVTIVPTVVMMREGAEIGRINGYMGPEAFFQSVSRTFGSAD